MYRYLLIFLFLLISTSSNSQITNDKKVYISPICGCKYMQTPPNDFNTSTNFRLLKNDSLNILVKKLYEISSNRVFSNTIIFDSTSKELVLKLLKYTKDNYHEECWFPFLRLMQGNSDSLSEKCCIPSPIVSEFNFYCSKTTTQFLSLYFIHFLLLKNKLINNHSFIQDIRLDIKNQKENKLDSIDFEKIYKIYTEYFNEITPGTSLIFANPLRKSKYKWTVKSERF